MEPIQERKRERFVSGEKEEPEIRAFLVARATLVAITTMLRLDSVSFVFVFVICGIIGMTAIGMVLCVVFPYEKIRDCCWRTFCKEKRKLIFQSRRRFGQVEPEPEVETRNSYFRNDQSISEVV